MAGLYDLSKAVRAEVKGITDAEMVTVIDETFKAIKKFCEQDEKVMVKGFGTFSKRILPAKDGINPLTQKPLKVPEKSKIVLKTTPVPTAPPAKAKK